jgi:6-phosphogluconate dehydrogenase
MGVSGSGKTTVGKLLSEHLSVPFYDGDDFHPKENVDKMREGIPLTDDDRVGWLNAINEKARTQSGGAVFACSALKEKYREMLAYELSKHIEWIHLKGDFKTIVERMEKRTDHFMPAKLLQSQFETLEEPSAGISVDISQSPEKILETIMDNTKKTKTEFGLVGLGVMGKSLSRNLAQKGFRLSLYNRHEAVVEEKVAERFVTEFPELDTALGFDDLETFVNSMATPRKIFLMIKAGAATDEFIENILPFLSPSDVLIDGGNSLYTDTKRRIAYLKTKGVHFIGTGVSGGEEGALKGPSVMPSGDPEAYVIVSKYLTAIAAKDKHGNPCCTYVGKEGSGHFIKMVHNGVEYAEMQLIAEVYAGLRYVNKFTPDEIADIFETWNATELSSYLLEITVSILRKKEGDQWLIDLILDKAGNKGTGNWTTVSAAELGIPATMISSALFARYISAFKQERVKFSENYRYQGIDTESAFDSEVARIAYTTARILNHHQGFELMKAASDEFQWGLDFPEIARIWTNGCIIRSVLMDELSTVFKDNKSMFDSPDIKTRLEHGHKELKVFAIQMITAGISIPCHLSALDYLNAYSTGYATANVLQAQRDFFGAHTYQRTDDLTGKFHHTQWI